MEDGEAMVVLPKRNKDRPGGSSLPPVIRDEASGFGSGEWASD
jgi:hypothetical protein